jgi:hypothetical protein
MNLWRTFIAAVALVLIAMPAAGAIILRIGSVTAAQGWAGNPIEVEVQNTGAAAIVIAGFNFEISADSDIDFTGANFSTSAPYIFAGDSFDQANSLPLNTTSGLSLSAGDISNSGNGDTLAAGQTAGLALVTFHVSPSAVVGPIVVFFSTDPSNTNLSDQNGDAIAIGAFENGTITITPANVVPEPSSAAALLAALIALGACRVVRCDRRHSSG